MKKDQTFGQVLEAASRLSPQEQRQLIDRLAQELDSRTAVVPVALLGSWIGVSLSAEEIDEARRECWTGLGAEE